MRECMCSSDDLECQKLIKRTCHAFSVNWFCVIFLPPLCCARVATCRRWCTLHEPELRVTSAALSAFSTSEVLLVTIMLA